MNSKNHNRQRPFLRQVALWTACAVAWLSLAPALAEARPLTQPTGHVRTLAPAEMQNIVGAQGGPAGISEPTPLSSESGQSFPWEGSVGDVNTGNGNKLTSLPLVAWGARGGRLGVGFTLYHNSQSTYNDELGAKRTHSYDLYIAFENHGVADQTVVHMGSDLSLAFEENWDGTMVVPFVKTVSGADLSIISCL